MRESKTVVIPLTRQCKLFKYMHCLSYWKWYFLKGNRFN